MVPGRNIAYNSLLVTAQDVCGRVYNICLDAWNYRLPKQYMYSYNHHRGARIAHIKPGQSALSGQGLYRGRGQAGLGRPKPL